MRRRGAAAVVVFATALAMVVAGAAEAQGVSLGFDFEDGPGGYADPDAWNSGCFSAAAAQGCVQTSRDGTLRAVPHDDGSALRFPSEGSAVIRVSHDEAFNPGRSDFTVSAVVRLTSAQAKAGANVIQKGMYDSRGQWKLQVDSGVPSCRIAGRTEQSRQAIEVRANRRVDSGEWTSIRCVRAGSRLELLIDGVGVDSSGKADVDIDNRDPVLIGGKHAGAGNDQFRGDLDDVGVAIV